MLGGTDLLTVVAKLPGGPYTRVLYRAIHLEALYGFHRMPPHPRPQPLYSLGAPIRGARFTPRGGPASLYLAEDTETAISEANQVNLTIRRQNAALAPQIEPTVMVAVTVHLESVLDLTEAPVQAMLGTDTTELTRPWRIPPPGGLPPTQELGAALFASGKFQAARYPSARRPGGSCLVVFTDRIQDPAFVEVHDPRGNVHQRRP